MKTSVTSERHKLCTCCGKVKTLSEFARDANRSDGRRSHCRVCLKRADGRRWIGSAKRRESTRQSVRRWRLRALYDITEEALAALYAAQDGRCAICRRPGALLEGRRDEVLHIDHDHDTEIVRGLLCHCCNGGLGLFRDSPETLVSAVAYLSERKGK